MTSSLSKSDINRTNGGSRELCRTTDLDLSRFLWPGSVCMYACTTTTFEKLYQNKWMYHKIEPAHTIKSTRRKKGGASDGFDVVQKSVHHLLTNGDGSLPAKLWTLAVLSDCVLSNLLWWHYIKKTQLGCGTEAPRHQQPNKLAYKAQLITTVRQDSDYKAWREVDI